MECNETHQCSGLISLSVFHYHHASPGPVAFTCPTALITFLQTFKTRSLPQQCLAQTVPISKMQSPLCRYLSFPALLFYFTHKNHCHCFSFMHILIIVMSTTLFYLPADIPVHNLSFVIPKSRGVGCVFLRQGRDFGFCFVRCKKRPFLGRHLVVNV